MYPFATRMLAGVSAVAVVVATTWDPAFKGAGVTLSADLLTATGPSPAKDTLTRGTASRTSGKRYFECRLIGSTSTIIGVCTAAAVLTDFPGSNANSIGYFPGGGNLFVGGVNGGAIGTSAVGDTVGVAVDLAAGKIWFLKNGTSLSGDPSAGTGGFATPSGALYPAVDVGEANASVKANFGASPFAYTPPSGFITWS